MDGCCVDCGGPGGPCVVSSESGYEIWRDWHVHPDAEAGQEAVCLSDWETRREAVAEAARLRAKTT